MLNRLWANITGFFNSYSNEIHTVRPVIRAASARGFTIVELLIVIIVIGILAAIIIVAYNGVSTSARDSSAIAAGKTLQKKFEAYNARNGQYPSSTATTDLATYQESTLTGSSLVIRPNAAITTVNGASSAFVEICTAPAGANRFAYRITYFNYPGNIMPAVGSPQITGGTQVAACTTWTVAT